MSVTTTSTSKQFWLNSKDFLRGLLMAVLTAPLTAIYTTIQAGSFTLDWKAIGLMASGGFLAYIIKNFFTPSAVKITPPPDATQVTVNIPEPGKTIKSALMILIIVSLASSVHAQSFFKPIPKPTQNEIFKARALIQLSDSVAVSSTQVNMAQNSFRPVASVTASISDGTALAGGIGISFQHNTFDAPSQTWVTQYSVAAIAFLDTRASLVGGLVLGFLNYVQLGPGYDFTTKKIVLLTGVTIKFN